MGVGQGSDAEKCAVVEEKSCHSELDPESSA
jgi:hypothetical protein